LIAFLGRLLVRTAAGSVLLAAVAGIPGWLSVAFGWPLPDHWPSLDELSSGLTGQVTDQMVLNLIAIATWLVWLLFVQALAAELRDALRGVRSTGRRLNPLRTVAAALVSALLLGSVLTATATATPASAPARATTAATAPVAVVSIQTPAAHGPVTVTAGDTRYTYIVKRGDYLSKIAKAWLGDADRWPEICSMNKHRHFPKVGGTLRDCNLIYPGWDLRLPADARPPADAKPAQPPAPPPVQQPDDGVVTPSPSHTTAPAATPSATASPEATRSPSANAANPVVPPSPASAPPQSASLTATASATFSPPDASPSAATADGEGVRLPDGSWVTWALAAAITAASALVWLQRRRRFTGEPDKEPPTELPPPVTHLRRAALRNPTLDTPADDAEQAAAVPELAALPAGGIGVLGDGAHAAARAALVAVLASGGPHHPHTRGEVIIDADTLTTLIGSDAATLGPWPRLHIAEDVDHALTIIEARLLYRSRILDEHALTDLDTLREQVPEEEALPPLLLVCATPPPGARMRAKVSLALGTGLHVSALLLGEWAHGATVQVAADGHTRLVAGQSAEPMPPRLPVLQAAAAVQVLVTLREAHTGEPPATAAFATAAVPLAANHTTPADTETAAVQPVAEAPAAAGAGKARLCVLGPPRIEDTTKPGKPLRAKALELGVFLACHPDGMGTREIGEYLEPDAKVDQSDQRVHTNASNLRHVLGRAGTAEAKDNYVIKAAGRYRLDPATVAVDVWQLRDLLRTATIATGERRRTLLTQACELYTAPLAEGQDYEWITPHREAVRRWGTEAHLLLAEDLLDVNPQAASTLLDKAIGLDRYNEALYRKAMHARHALGDADGIRTLLRALTKSLADLDAEPEEETITLAAELRARLERR